jgi:hypothetical protein
MMLIEQDLEKMGTIIWAESVVGVEKELLAPQFEGHPSCTSQGRTQAMLACLQDLGADALAQITGSMLKTVPISESASWAMARTV